MPITHSFVSSVSDDADPNTVSPSDWNDDHAGTADAITSSTSSLATTEGTIGWQSSDELVRIYDGQRERAVSASGWVPFLYMPNFVSTAALTTSATIAANGGSIAIPFYNPGHMLLQRALFRERSTTLARAVEGALYVQPLNNGNSGENTLNRVAGTDGTASWTASAVSTQAISMSGSPVYIGPGAYWYVIRVTQASNNISLASTAVSNEMANNSAQTKTLGSALGSTLDFVAATWTKVTAMYAVRLEGRVFGQTSQF